MNLTKLLFLCLVVACVLVDDVDGKRKKKKKKTTNVKKIDNDLFGVKKISKKPEGNTKSEKNVPAVIPPNILKMLNNVGNDLSKFVSEFKPPGIEEKGNVLKYITSTDETQKTFADPKDTGCAPRLQLEAIPTQAGTIFWPGCVRVYRCGGCCTNSFNQECVPVEKKKAITSVFKIKFADNIAQVHDHTLDHHEKCQCQCRVKPDDCLPTQTFSKQNCQCECKKSPQKCESGKYWSHQACGCICSDKPATCSTWKKMWDDKQCACVCTKAASTCEKKNKKLDQNTCRCV